MHHKYHALSLLLYDLLPTGKIQAMRKVWEVPGKIQCWAALITDGKPIRLLRKHVILYSCFCALCHVRWLGMW